MCVRVSTHALPYTTTTTDNNEERATQHRPHLLHNLLLLNQKRADDAFPDHLVRQAPAVDTVDLLLALANPAQLTWAAGRQLCERVDGDVGSR